MKPRRRGGSAGTSAARSVLSVETHVRLLLSTLIFVTPSFPAFAQASTVADLPPEVANFVTRRGLCDHLRGKAAEAADAESVQRVNDACQGTDLQLARLWEKYRSDVPVTIILSPFEADIETWQRRLAIEIRDLLRQAHQAGEDSNWAKANRLAVSALAKLGDSYRTAGTIDDSGMRLALAGAEEARGKLELAASLRQVVARSRLEMFRRKHGIDASHLP